MNTMYESWEQSTPKQRLAMLQTVENQLAKAQNRPPAKLSAQYMASNRRGYYSLRNNTITMNHDMIAFSKDPQLCLQNIFHESRHAYQHHAILYPDKHPELQSATIRSWSENMANYRRYDIKKIQQDVQRASKQMTPSQTQRLQRKANKRIFEDYQKQAVERDARSYSQSMLSKVSQSLQQSRSTVHTHQNQILALSNQTHGISLPDTSSSHGHSSSAGLTSHSISHGSSAMSSGLSGGHSGLSGGHSGLSGGHSGLSGGHSGLSGGHGGLSGGHGSASGGHGSGSGGHSGHSK